jgi:hypothetical protein
MKKTIIRQLFLPACLSWAPCPTQRPDSAQMPAWKARMDFWTVTLSSPPEHLLRAISG